MRIKWPINWQGGLPIEKCMTLFNVTVFVYNCVEKVVKFSFAFQDKTFLLKLNIYYPYLGKQMNLKAQCLINWNRDTKTNWWN